MAEDGARTELFRAARAILRPLVRLLIAHGITFPAFSRLAREVYIEVGTKYFALPFKKQTDSRVALVTGVTRKEIGQIRRGQVLPMGDAAHFDYGVATRVIGRWVSERRYCDAAGAPRRLAYEPRQQRSAETVALGSIPKVQETREVPGQAEGDSATFVTLVDEVGGDIPPRAVLDELIRVGAVALSPNGDVRLLNQAYIPAHGTEEKLAILGTDASELISAIAHNIAEPQDDAFLQRKVYYDNVGADALADLRQRVRQLGGTFIQDVNQVLSACDRDRHPEAPGGARKRTVVGLFYFDEDYEPPPPPSPPPAKRKA
jgi:hypothetical protein